MTKISQGIFQPPFTVRRILSIYCARDFRFRGKTVHSLVERNLDALLSNLRRYPGGVALTRSRPVRAPLPMSSAEDDKVLKRKMKETQNTMVGLGSHGNQRLGQRQGQNLDAEAAAKVAAASAAAAAASVSAASAASAVVHAEQDAQTMVPQGSSQTISSHVSQACLSSRSTPPPAPAPGVAVSGSVPPAAAPAYNSTLPQIAASTNGTRLDDVRSTLAHQQQQRGGVSMHLMAEGSGAGASTSAPSPSIPHAFAAPSSSAGGGIGTASTTADMDIFDGNGSIVGGVCSSGSNAPDGRTNHIHSLANGDLARRLREEAEVEVGSISLLPRAHKSALTPIEEGLGSKSSVLSFNSTRIFRSIVL